MALHLDDRVLPRMRTLGLSLAGHGAAICLVDDGRVVAATNLERLVRKKFAFTAPSELLARMRMFQRSMGHERPSFDFVDVWPALLGSVAGTSGLDEASIDLVVVMGPYDEEQAEPLIDLFAGHEVVFDLEHHLCHAYQAFLSSEFDDCAVLTVDGMGQPVARHGGQSISTTWGSARGTHVEVLDEVLFPNSLGGLYSEVTRFLGFDGEQQGNTMALAGFGRSEFYKSVVGDVLDLGDRGEYSLALDDAGDGPAYKYVLMAREIAPARNDNSDPIQAEHEDVAYGVQAIVEDAILNAARAVQSETGSPRLAVAGGVGLNCVANTRLLRETAFDDLYVMPNAGDRGLAVGAALYGHHVLLGNKKRYPPASDYLGRFYEEAEIRSAIAQARGIEFLRSSDIASECAALIADGRILGWFQGGAEFGPRALGHRSILADPRTVSSKTRLDTEIKRRERFRPYAPSVLAERAGEYFDMNGPSPFMLQAVRVRESVRDEVPAIVHVDGSARVQTVARSAEPRFHRLIEQFAERTGVPVVLNTSFNGYGDPIVETPADALACLVPMNLDAVAIGDFIVWRADRTLGR